MDEQNTIIDKVYESRERMIIIGLTGRTGSGCSTVAHILEKEDYETLDIKTPKDRSFDNSEERKDYIINNYMKEPGRWMKFSVIDLSSIILSCVFELGEKKLCEYIESITSDSGNTRVSIGDYENFMDDISRTEYMFEECIKFPLDIDNDYVSGLTDKQLQDYYFFYMNTIKEYKERFKSILENYSCREIHIDRINGRSISKYHLYTFLMQRLGNNIRCSGSPYCCEFNSEKYKLFMKRVDNLIKIINRYNEYCKLTSTRICIDAIRNPYEAMFLKDKYRAFYLMAINTDDGERIDRLSKLTEEERENLDSVEYAQKMEIPEGIFYHQSIASCVEYAGIHVYNPHVSDGKYYELTSQIIKYIALIIHPGLITPTHIERCMQLAYNAKFNSGCLSRQVGAVVTRDDYSIQSIGWNDVPKGQVTCLLRDVGAYCRNKDRESYSKFEIEDSSFSEALNIINDSTVGKLHGHCMPYCFKDVYNNVTDQKKNQVYTRALHAEENAFLQISKYGGTQVKNGVLFCTASPCELCAKKAYQLGIKQIYYINPYPGISQKHILTFGENGNPETKLFYGAIGQAYIDFYEPRIATKDELEILTGINVKKLVSKKNEDRLLEYEDIEFNSVEVVFIFRRERNEIECKRTIEAVVCKEHLEEIKHVIRWTGSSYDGTTVIKEKSDPDIRIVEQKEKTPYIYTIKATRNKGELIKYSIVTKAKDEKNMMEPYLAHMVKHRTRNLSLKVLCKESEGVMCEVRAVTYADLDMKTCIERKALDQKKYDGQMIGYEINICRVNE